MRRSKESIAAMARTRRAHTRMRKEGMPEPQMGNGYLERTKRLIDAAYEVWRIKNGIPRYSHFNKQML